MTDFNFIKREQKKLEDQKFYVENLEKIVKEFPDLREENGRWNNKFLCSKEINKIADKAAFTHSCGCCDDALLYVMPCIERNGIYIYSYPPQIVISDDHWKENLIKENINSLIIEKCEKYFKENDLCGN